MSPDNSKKTAKHKFNLVIVGGGGAGLAAAAAAAEKGVRNIAVLEKRGATGGSSAMASGIFAAESPTQKRQAIIAPKDVLFKRIMDWTRLSVNPRIVRAYIEKSADTVRWLEDKGLHFTCVPHSPVDNPLTWHVPKGNGAEITGTLAKTCRDLSVEIFLNTSLKKILTDSKGAVTGVLADSKDGDITFNADAVVIATGGFGGDKDLLKKYCPKYRENMRLSGQPNMGEGIFKALEIGAAADGLGILMGAGPFGAGVRMLTLGKEPDIIHIPMIFITSEPSVIWINKQGRRFIDETVSSNHYEIINALIRQTDGVAYALFDAALIRHITETGFFHVASGFEYGEKHRSPLPEGLEQELQIQADKGAIKISDSWDDIADWLDIDRTAIKTTVAEYNANCDRGHDPVFAKDRASLQPLRTPPYYAVRGGSTYLNTLGGLKINERMEVLDTRDNPIHGLYAAGVDTGGWTSDTYCAALPGTAFGYAINSGRIAGESASEFITNSK
jgi:fumarate reductase flavoprotein subunit